MFRWGVIAFICTICAPAFSQTFPLVEQSFGIGVLDADRLFSESRFGQTFILDFETQAAVIAEENQKIEQALEAEELELTRLRNTENPENFNELAEAFDEKANRIREERRLKTQELVEFREKSQQIFFNQVGPVLINLMREKRIAIIVEREAVVLSLPTVDLTSDAIRRIDQAFAR